MSFWSLNPKSLTNVWDVSLLRRSRGHNSRVTTYSTTSCLPETGSGHHGAHKELSNEQIEHLTKYHTTRQRQTVWTQCPILLQKVNERVTVVSSHSGTLCCLVTSNRPFSVRQRSSGEEDRRRGNPHAWRRDSSCYVYRFPVRLLGHLSSRVDKRILTPWPYVDGSSLNSIHWRLSSHYTSVDWTR